MKESQEFPSSKFDRSKVIAKTGFKIGTNYAKFHLQRALGKNRSPEAKKELNRANANELFKDFSKLRGTALKLAQGLSLDSSMLPSEFAEVLTQSQYSVPPINKVLVRNIIKQQLGDWPENMFESFDLTATAAASLGQVHRAVTKDGQILAIKVQYPNVRDTIESDLSLARIIFERIVKSERTDAYFEEVRSKLLEETDYRIEGRQLTAFRNLYHQGNIATPEWVEEYSTRSVLAMTWLKGKHLKDFLDTNPSQEEINHFGQLLWDFFHLQLNDSFTVHADAHPGNYLFMDDGRLGVLDFGCVKVCPEDFFRNYLALFVAHRDKDQDKIKQLYYDLEILDRTDEMSEYERYFFNYTLGLGELFVSPYNNEYFDFGDAAFLNAFNEFAKEAASFKEPRGSKHFIFITRAHIGLYQMLIKMKARIHITPGRERLYTFLERHGIQELV